MNLTLLALVVAGLSAEHCNGASIFPVYDEGGVTFDDRVLGTWWYESDKAWLIEPTRMQRYLARSVDGDDTTDYELVLAKVEDAHLADLRAPHLGNSYELLRLHWYSRLHVTDSVLTYQPLDDSWVETYVPAHPREIAYLIIDGSVIFTAPPREVQRFLRRHWKDRDAWGRVVTVRRTRPEE
jgi:hypothetical protein